MTRNEVQELIDKCLEDPEFAEGVIFLAWKPGPENSLDMVGLMHGNFSDSDVCTILAGILQNIYEDDADKKEQILANVILNVSQQVIYEDIEELAMDTKPKGDKLQ